MAEPDQWPSLEPAALKAPMVAGLSALSKLALGGEARVRDRNAGAGGWWGGGVEQGNRCDYFCE